MISPHHFHPTNGGRPSDFNTFGTEKNSVGLGRGIRKIEVPVSGYVELLAE